MMSVLARMPDVRPSKPSTKRATCRRGVLACAALAASLCLPPVATAAAPVRAFEPVTPADNGAYNIKFWGAADNGSVAWSTDGSPDGVTPDGGSVFFELDLMGTHRSPTGWVSDQLPLVELRRDATSWLSPDEELSGEGFEAG